MNNIFYHFKQVVLCLLIVAAGIRVNAQCTAPASVTAVARTCDSIGVSWPAVTNALNYTYAITNSATPPTAGAGSVTGTSIEFGNLNQGTLYYVHIRTNCFGSTSAWTTGSITNCGTFCPQPTNVTPSTSTSNSLTATWGAATGVLGYEYVLDQSLNNPSGAGTFTTALTGTVSGLTSGSTYYWHVRSKCSATSFSAWRAPSGATTSGVNPGCPPPATTGVAIRRCDSVSITWAAAPGALTYQAGLTEYAGTVPTMYMYNQPGLSTEWPLTLAATTRYYYYVRTNCNMSYGDWRIDSFTTPACVTGGNCPALATVTVNPIACDSVKLLWTSFSTTTTNARNYTYAVTTTAIPPLAGRQVITAGGLGVGVGGLLPSTLYYAHVRTNCPGSNAWKTQSFTTPACGGTPCNAPTTVNNSAVTASSATFTWTAVTGAIGYEYVVDQTMANPAGSGTLTTGVTATSTGLSPSTTYYLHVRTKCSATSFSAWRAAVAVTTLAGTNTCIAPTGVSWPIVASRTATVTWTAATGAIGYEYVVTQQVGTPTGSGTATTGMSASLTGLTPSTVYYIYVRSKCSATTFSAWTNGTIMQTANATAVANIQGTDDAVLIYPNPANQSIQLSFKATPRKGDQLHIYSVDGRKVMSLSATNAGIIDISKIPAGAYFLQYINGNNRHMSRFTKE